LNIFFSGIGGSGVSALAGLAAAKGQIVSGSDRAFDRDPDNELLRHFNAAGIRIVRQDGTGIRTGLDLAVFSTAVEKDNPDLIRAVALGVPVKTRPEYLIDLVGRYRTIAVAGTSGKSTTAGLLAFLMGRLGMDPNFIGGGRVKQFVTAGNAGNFRAGNSDSLVVEACESDGTLGGYRPRHAIIANLDLDHHSIAETAALFEGLAEHTADRVVAGGDDDNLASCRIRRAVRFSIERESEYRATEVEHGSFETRFVLHGVGLRLCLPGRHNVYNALAAIAMLAEMGVPVADIAGILPEYSGVERRFDVHLNNGRHLVVDDYAHNPHKIASLFQTMRRVSPRICYIFQPHGYGPTRFMRDGYVRTFAENLRREDRLVILPIYFAGGTASRDISSGDIAQAVSETGASAEAVEDRRVIMDMLGPWQAYVIFGARDESLSALARDIARRLSGA
jgi:UDP-N-acetylmuramate-alanine ligase